MKMRLITLIIVFTLIHAHQMIEAKPVQNEEFYHDWSLLLHTYVTPDGVDYKGLQSDQRLSSFITTLSTVQIESYDRDSRLAFWINAYNALCIKQVLQYYPQIKSVKTAIKGAKPYAFFKQKVHHVAGQVLSLDDIEHKILRVEFKDYRIHAALNCASYSCPVLVRHAYLPSKVQTQLTTQFRKFLLDPLRNKIGKRVYLSKIFQWFAEDFKEAGGVRKVLRQSLPQSHSIYIVTATQFHYLPYDWQLNDRHPNSN